MLWTFYVSWQPGNGATPGGPGVEYRLAPGQNVTPLIPVKVTAQSGAGWGSADYQLPVDLRAEPHAEGVSLVQLADAFGNIIPGNRTPPLQGGTWEGMASVRVAANSPGYPFRDVGLMATSTDGTQTSGGLQNSLRVYGAAAPAQFDEYEVFGNGVSGGRVRYPQGTNVTITRNQGLIWPNYYPGR